MKTTGRTAGLAAAAICAAIAAAADIVQFGIGRKTPTLDGTVSPDEYGAFVPYMYVIDGYMKPEDLPYSDRSPESYFAWDDECIYFAMVSEGSNLKSSVTEHDGPVYNDDSIDFFVSHNGSKSPLHHFIFNSLGTVYDAKDDDRSWNAEGTRVATKAEGGKWTIEVAVPWRNFGFTPKTTLYAPHLNLCRTYRSGQGSSVKFIDMDENFSVGLAHGPFAARATQALVFLREKVSKVDFPELIPPRPGENARKQMVSLKEPGNPKEIVFWGLYPLMSHDPVTFRFVTTDIPTKTLLFCTENNFPMSEKYTIELDFRDMETDSRSALRLVGEAAKARGAAQQGFSVASLPDGEYKLHYRIVAPDGSTAAEDFTYYGKYPENPPWKDCADGAEDETPQPWTDPVFNGDSFKCWGRTVKFGGDGIVSSAVSAGRELLAAPVRLLVNGRAAKMRVVSVEPHKSFADYVLAADTPAGLKVKARAEFDGYIWFDVVRPAGTVSSLSVEMPIRRDMVTGFDDGHSVIEKLPLPPGTRGKWTFDPRERPFFWIGNGEVGLMGGTEDRRGWNLGDPRRGYTLDVDGESARVTINFVDSPSKSDRPTAVGFYMNPTPVRPKNVALERFNPSKMCRWTGQVAKFSDMKGPGQIMMDKVERFKKRQANGEKVFWYQGSAIAAPYSPLWAWFGKEWNFTGNPSTVYLEVDPKNRDKRDHNGWIWGCLRDKSFFDYRMWSSSWFLNHPDFAVSNLYFDISFPKACRNGVHGCSNEYFFRGMREFHKRTYRQLKRKNPDGAMLGHVRFVRTPSDNFFDESWCGEAYEIQVAKQHNYYNLLSPEAMQIHYASRAADMVMAISCQIYRTYQVYCPAELKSYDPYAPDADRAIRHAAAYFKIHNLLITIRPEETFCGTQWWTAESYAHFLGPDRKFSAYYMQDCPVTVDAPERLFLHAMSWHGGEAAIVLLNDTDDTVTKKISVDTAKIGLKSLRGREIFGRGEFSLENGSFDATLGPRESMFIAFRGEKTLPSSLAGEVRLSCPTTGAWKVSFEKAAAPEPGVEDFEVKLQSESDAPPPNFSVSFSIPQGGAHFAWHSEAENPRLPPKWHRGFVSSLAHGLPLIELMGCDDMNCLAFATSEAILPVRCRAGLKEADCSVPCSLSFFELPAAPMKSYSAKIRLDARRRRWDDTVRDLSGWVEKTGGYVPMDVPESARDPLYSTWYAFAQDVSAAKIEDEARRAAALGMKTLILDDGWQTDETGRAYERCGDMTVSKAKFPDGMAAHVAKVQAAGLKYLVWVAVPFVGKKNAQYERFRGKYLRDQESVHCSVLDPRFPEVREYLASLFERMMREWKVDGFKFDYVGQLALRDEEVDPAVAEGYAGRDFKSVPDAVDAMMTEIVRRLTAVRKDVLIEYRQPYLGPAIRRYGNMIRAIDCPGEMQKNIVRTAMLRLTSGDCAVHSDMLEWNAGASAEDAAQAVLASLFSTIQYSMVLSRLPERHLKMLRHWIGFTQDRREALLKGRFRAHGPHSNFTVLESETDGDRVAAAYAAETVVKVGSKKRETVVNATGRAGLVVDLESPRLAVIRDTFGAERGRKSLGSGIARLDVPKSGYAEFAGE